MLNNKKIICAIGTNVVALFYKLVMNKKEKKSKRQYPPLYEKGVPIALGIIVVAIIVLLIVIFGVALGLIPGTG